MAADYSYDDGENELTIDEKFVDGEHVVVVTVNATIGTRSVTLPVKEAEKIMQYLSAVV